MQTHLHHFYEWVNKKPNDIFLRQPYGKKWVEITYSEAFAISAKIATAIQDKGITKGEHIAIFSKNCYHWILADLAIMMAGCVSVPFYPTINGEELNDLLKRGNCRMLFLGKLDQFTPTHHKASQSIFTIRFPHYDGNAAIDIGEDWNMLLEKNLPIAELHYPTLNEIWSILFTSGTTGTPKGVVLTYRSPAALMDMEQKHHAIGIFKVKEFRFISYLPLNHIAERMIVEAACFLSGGTISFAESLDSFAKNLQEIQPTVFMSVPRLYTKIQLAVLEKLGGAKRFKILMQLPIVGSFLRNKIKKTIGLSQAEVTLTGAAPTPDAVKDWYLLLGIKLREVYGMTENTGGCTLMPADNIKSGTIGKPLPGVTLKIDAATEEICTKADWLMQCYYNEPEKTQEAMADGWLHTGDRGEIDEEGFIRITGRVSDTFKTAKGKFIVPAPIEWLFAKSEMIEQVCVMGIGVPQPLALINLSLIGKHAEKDEIVAHLQHTLAIINTKLANYQKIGKIIVVEEDWTVDNDILTPSMKIKRNSIDKKYGGLTHEWSSRQEEILFY